MYASFCHGKPKTCTKAFLRELEIQSMTFPNNIITVGKNGSKNPKTKINGLRVWSSLLLENGQEQASRIPQKMWFLNALIVFLLSSSHFLGKSATLPFPEFILTDKHQGHGLKTQWSRGQTDLQFAGNYPLCGKTKTWVWFLGCRSWDAIPQPYYGLYAQVARGKFRKWLVTAFLWMY